MGFLEFGEQALNGLIISTFYALTALGLALIFGVLRIVNFAHGELYMLGGYAGYLVVTILGLPPVVGVVAAAASLLVFGALLERTLIRPVYTGKVDRPDEYAIMITFALSVLLLNLANSVFGPWPQRPAPAFGFLRSTAPLSQRCRNTHGRRRRGRLHVQNRPPFGRI